MASRTLTPRPVAASEPIGVAPRPPGTSRLAGLTVGLRDFGRRRRTLITVVGSLATAVILAFLLAGRGDEFAAALSGPAAWVLADVLLQIVALLARSEARHLSIRVAGGTVDRRVFYRTAELREETSARSPMPSPAWTGSSS